MKVGLRFGPRTRCSHWICNFPYCCRQNELLEFNRVIEVLCLTGRDRNDINCPTGVLVPERSFSGILHLTQSHPDPDSMSPQNIQSSGIDES